MPATEVAAFPEEMVLGDPRAIFFFVKYIFL